MLLCKDGRLGVFVFSKNIFICYRHSALVEGENLVLTDVVSLCISQINDDVPNGFIHMNMLVLLCSG
jgi:hypothetical protein